MNKKMTREESQKFFQDLTEKVEKMFKDSGYYDQKIRKRITHKTVLVNGQEKTKSICTKCGHEVIADRGMSCCKSCGNSDSPFVNNDVHYAFNCDLGPGLAFFGQELRYWTRSEEFTMERLFVCCDDGLTVWDPQKGRLVKKTENSIKEVKKAISVDLCANIKEFPDIYDRINTAIASSETKMSQNKEKARQSKNGVLEEMHRNYNPKKSLEECYNSFNSRLCESGNAMYFFTPYDTQKNEFLFGCPICGGVEVFTFDETVTDFYKVVALPKTCPACGYKFSFGSYHDKYHLDTLCSVSLTNLPERDLLLRYIDVRYDFDVDTMELKHTCAEYTRIYCGSKISQREFNSDNNAWEPTRIRRWFANKYLRCETDDEIEAAVKNSAVAYSGLLTAWGIGTQSYPACEKFGRTEYISAWYNYPGVELVIKSPMRQLAQAVVGEDAKVICPNKGKSLSEVMGVSQKVVNIALAVNPSPDDLPALAALVEADPNMTAEIYKEIDESGANKRAFVVLKKEGISYQQALKYLQSVFDYQCIEKHDAMNIWGDYLRMARLLNFNLDKSRLFPSSLKKEHDVTMYAYSKVKTKVDEQVFAERAAENAKKYQYSFEDLCVVIPQKAEDIIREATIMHNCLRSYVNRVMCGSTVIAFIRKKDAIEETYLAAEINNGRLIQLEGAFASHPRDLKTMTFVNKWAKACKFINALR